MLETSLHTKISGHTEIEPVCSVKNLYITRLFIRRDCDMRENDGCSPRKQTCNSRSSAVLLCILLVPLLLLPWSSYAGATRSDDGNQALKRMQYMLQQLDAEKAALEEEKRELEKDVESLAEDLEAAQEEIELNQQTILTLESRIMGLNGKIDRKDAAIEKREGQLRDVISKYQDTVLLVRQLNAEKAGLERTVADLRQTIEEQQQKNLKLYEANVELMDLYENKSGWDALLQKEKITGLKQVEIENILQEYRLQLLDNRIDGPQSAQK